MSTHTHIELFAAALQASATLRDYCVARWGRGALIQVDESPAAPLTHDEAPWVCLISWPTEEQGPVATNARHPILLACGTAPRQAGADPAAPVVAVERSAAANGLRSYTAAAEAEGLRDLVLTILKEVALDGAQLATSEGDSDGWTHLPLATSSAVLTVEVPQTL